MSIAAINRNDDEFEIEKSEILDELTELCSDDIGKIHVSELLLKYYGSVKIKPITKNPWKVQDNAARQLHNANRFGLRTNIVKYHSKKTRNFNKSNLKENIAPLSKEERIQRRQNAKNSPKLIDKTNSNASIVSSKSLDSLAGHMAHNALSRASVEHEISFISEEISKEALTNAEYKLYLQGFAVSLIERILIEAEKHVRYVEGETDLSTSDNHEDLYSVSRESSELSISRIERMAEVLVDRIADDAVEQLCGASDEED